MRYKQNIPKLHMFSIHVSISSMNLFMNRKQLCVHSSKRKVQEKKLSLKVYEEKFDKNMLLCTSYTPMLIIKYNNNSIVELSIEFNPKYSSAKYWKTKIHTNYMLHRE